MTFQDFEDGSGEFTITNTSAGDQGLTQRIVINGSFSYSLQDDEGGNICKAVGPSNVGFTIKELKHELYLDSEGTATGAGAFEIWGGDDPNNIKFTTYWWHGGDGPLELKYTVKRDFEGNLTDLADLPTYATVPDQSTITFTITDIPNSMKFVVDGSEVHDTGDSYNITGFNYRCDDTDAVFDDVLWAANFSEFVFESGNAVALNTGDQTFVYEHGSDLDDLVSDAGNSSVTFIGGDAIDTR